MMILSPIPYKPIQCLNQLKSDLLKRLMLPNLGIIFSHIIKEYTFEQFKIILW